MGSPKVKRQRSDLLSPEEVCRLRGWTPAQYERWAAMRGEGTRVNYRRHGIPASVVANELLKWWRDILKGLPPPSAPPPEDPLLAEMQSWVTNARLRARSLPLPEDIGKFMDDVGETWDLYNRWRDEYLLLKRVLRSSRTVGSVARATDIRPRKAPPPEIADAFVSPDVEELMSG